MKSVEKRFYQKVKDLYTTAIDYDGTSPVARDFCTKVQNKMPWAVTGHTVADIAQLLSDPVAANMGLTSWSGTAL